MDDNEDDDYLSLKGMIASQNLTLTVLSEHNHNKLNLNLILKNF